MKKLLLLLIAFSILFNTLIGDSSELTSNLFEIKQFESNELIESTYSLTDMACLRYADDKTPIALCAYHDGYMYATIPAVNANRDIEFFWANEIEFAENEQYCTEQHIFTHFQTLCAREILFPDKDGKIYPDNHLTRGEACNLFVKLGGFNKNNNVVIPFKDVYKDHMYYNDIAILCELGIVNGSGNNLFEPDRLITREELVVIASNFAKVLISNSNVNEPVKVTDLIEENKSEFNRDDFYSKYFKDKEKISAWAYEAYNLMDIYVMYDENHGYAYYSPQSYATRKELAKLFFGLLEINFGLITI